MNKIQIIKKIGKISSVEHLVDSHNERKLCVEIDGSIVGVVVGVNHLSCFADKELIGRTATIQFLEQDKKLELPTLLKVDDIFYKGLINKSL